MDEHSPEQLAELRSDLEKLRQDLLVVIRDDSGAAATVTLDQSTQGRLSRMDAMQQQKMAEANMRRAKVRLERVEAVLESFEDPSVDPGSCRECGDPVPFARLKAYPDALFCVPCLNERSR